MKTAVTALAVACSAAALYYTNGGIVTTADNADPSVAADTEGTTVDELMGLVGSVATMGTYSASGQTQQRQAWLDMISISEGTYGRGDNGYNVLVNPGGLFDNGYVDHPRIYVPAANSTAAGRYQILAKTWDGIKTVIGASDFSPANQDAAAIALTRRRGALADVDAGNIASAITKCNREWASFAGSPYNQHPHDMGTMLAWFQAQGGAIA